MNIVISLLGLPLVMFLVKKKLDTEAGSFKSLLITPLITIISLGIGIYGLTNNTSFVGFLLVLFLVFSLVGDVFNCLKEDHLLYGLIYFAVGHLLLMIVALLNCSFNMYLIFIFIILSIIMLLLFLKFKSNLNPIMMKAVPVYMGLATISAGFSFGSNSFLFMTGVISFYLSDIFLGMREFWFVNNRFFHILVWIFYPLGVYLIANSLIYNIF